MMCHHISGLNTFSIMICECTGNSRSQRNINTRLLIQALERGSAIVASNLPFDKRSGVFGSDQLIHQVQII